MSTTSWRWRRRTDDREVSPARQQVVSDRKELFEELNEFVSARNGWLTSVPGAAEVTMQCLVNSTLPDVLRARGYDLVEDGTTASASCRTRSPRCHHRGQHGPDQGRAHAGIVTVKRFSFDLPSPQGLKEPLTS